MKVYTKIVLDASGAILEEHSYEYSGPVALCKGDVNVPEAPGPTAEETALMKQQTMLLEQQSNILSSQLHTQELLAPYLYEQAGLKPIYSESSAAQEQVSSLQEQINSLEEQLSNTPQTLGTETVTK